MIPSANTGSCHLHVNNSPRYHFKLVSLCPNNDPSWPQTSALAKWGHILSLYKPRKPLRSLIPQLPDSCLSSPCWVWWDPHLPGTLLLDGLVWLPPYIKKGETHWNIFLLPQQVQFRLRSHIYVPLGAYCRGPWLFQSKAVRNIHTVKPRNRLYAYLDFPSSSSFHGSLIFKCPFTVSLSLHQLFS